MDRYLIGNVMVDEREKGRPILLFYHNASWGNIKVSEYI
jgi:hypothetical protein